MAARFNSPALDGRATRAGRRPAAGAVDADALPADVRLMRATANLLFMLAAIALLVLAVNAWIRQPAFALRAIRIEGDVARNSEATIRANAAPKLVGNFFTADLQQVRQAFESVPWVRRAEVRRVWPNRLVVRLEEHRAAAVWNDEATGDRLVNSAGELFEADGNPAGDADDAAGAGDDSALPVLAGPPGSSAHALALLRRLQPVLVGRLGGKARIERLAQSSRGSWRAELDNAAVVELGRGSDDELVARAERFAATVHSVTQHFQRPLEYADLRHHDGYAVRLTGVTTLAADAASAPRAGVPKAVSKSAAKQAAKPVAKVAVKPVTPQAIKPVGQPAAQPATPPTLRPVGPSATQPAVPTPPPAVDNKN